MNHDLEKNLKSYDNTIKDLEDKFLWCNNTLYRMESDIWDQENQNYENEKRFKKISKASLFKMNDP
jgi:hypothetical protein